MEPRLQEILKAEGGTVFTDSNIPCCKHTNKNSIKPHSSHQLFQNISSEEHNLRFKLF